MTFFERFAFSTGLALFAVAFCIWGGSTARATLRSKAPADVLAAAQSTPMYRSAAESNDLIGQALQLGTPVQVKPYQQTGKFATYWVIPVLNERQMPLALLTFLYDTEAMRLRASEFAAVANQMFYATHPFPALNAEQVAQHLYAQRHVRAAHRAELIYVPLDVQAMKQGEKSWSGGGGSAIDPIWRVRGVDGHTYYVDRTGTVYTEQQIPLDPAFPTFS